MLWNPHSPIDVLDPNELDYPDQYEHRIYGSADLEIYAIVDWVDYLYFSRWRWSVHCTRGKKKLYLRRATNEMIAPSNGWYTNPETGRYVRNRPRVQRNLFLHQAIMERTGIPKPTPSHKLVDHGDRDTMNCRRNNLNWATTTMNRHNELVYIEKHSSMI